MMNIPLFKVYMNPQAKVDVARVLDSGFIGEGLEVKNFERELNSYFNYRGSNYDVITCNSATSAEHLIYHYLKKDRIFLEYFDGVALTEKKWEAIQPNQHVLSTALTCTATNWPIINSGLTIRWVDVDPITCNMSLDDLKIKIDKYTRVINVVHWGGNPVDLNGIMEVVHNAEKFYGHSIMVIEDCAHAFGSRYNGLPVGFTGNISTFSFQAIKHITSVDGGMIASPYVSFTEDAKLLRWYGIDRNSPRADFRCEADIPEAGYKFHMNDVNAAVGRANLKHANKIVFANQSNAAWYNRELKDADGITLIPIDKIASSSYWLYTMHAERRDDLINYLKENGVASSRVHERNDLHTCTKPYRSKLPGVDKAVQTMISIPIGYWVGLEEREYITDLIKKGW